MAEREFDIGSSHWLSRLYISAPNRARQ